MSDYRRDKNLIKRTITEDSLTQIDLLLEEVEKRLLTQNAKSYCYLSFVIRYDDKGFRVFTYSELLAHYKDADSIEKINIRLDVSPSLPDGMSNKEIIDIFITSLPSQNSYFAVEGSDSHWVNSVFTMLDDAFKKSNSRYSWVTGTWINLTVQIVGVIFIFSFSLISSKYASPYINIENPLFITFIFFFLIFSNLWTFISPVILDFTYKVFPNIYFKRKDKSNFIDDLQNHLTSALLGLTVIVLTSLWYLYKTILLDFIK